MKYNKHKHKKGSWITKGIIRSIKFRDKLYKTLKSTDINSERCNTYKINLQTYNRILKQNIRLAKKTYYHSCFEKIKKRHQEYMANNKEYFEYTTKCQRIS